MNSALPYLVSRFFFRIADFFHHWYVDGTRSFIRGLMGTVERLDRTFAVGINLKFFFTPIYRDYSIIGRFLGVIFRSMRIVLGALLYLLIASLFFIAYMTWLSIPPLILSISLLYR